MFDFASPTESPVETFVDAGDVKRNNGLRRFDTYMIYRDGRPFMMVNAALLHVCTMVQRFAHSQADFAWTFKECEHP